MWQKILFIPFLCCIHMKQVTIISVVHAMALKTTKYVIRLPWLSFLKYIKKCAYSYINLIKFSLFISLSMCFCRMRKDQQNLDQDRFLTGVWNAVALNRKPCEKLKCVWKQNLIWICAQNFRAEHVFRSAKSFFDQN